MLSPLPKGDLRACLFYFNAIGEALFADVFYMYRMQNYSAYKNRLTYAENMV